MNKKEKVEFLHHFMMYLYQQGYIALKCCNFEKQAKKYLKYLNEDNLGAAGGYVGEALAECHRKKSKASVGESSCRAEKL